MKWWEKELVYLGCIAAAGICLTAVILNHKNTDISSLYTGDCQTDSLTTLGAMMQYDFLTYGFDEWAQESVQEYDISDLSLYEQRETLVLFNQARYQGKPVPELAIQARQIIKNNVDEWFEDVLGSAPDYDLGFYVGELYHLKMDFELEGYQRKEINFLIESEKYEEMEQLAESLVKVSSDCGRIYEIYIANLAGFTTDPIIISLQDENLILQALHNTSHEVAHEWLFQNGISVEFEETVVEYIAYEATRDILGKFGLGYWQERYESWFNNRFSSNEFEYRSIIVSVFREFTDFDTFMGLVTNGNSWFDDANYLDANPHLKTQEGMILETIMDEIEEEMGQ